MNESKAPAAERMKIKSIVPYFGGKRNLAPKIVEAMGLHRVYWEPFCGSMAILMAKPPCVMETVNDLHADLINLARVIQDSKLGSQLYRKLRRTMMHEQFFIEAAERYRDRGYYAVIDQADMERAYDFFVCSWVGRNGVGGTKSYNQGFCLRFTATGGHAARRWLSVIESIPAWRRRLMNVSILQRDAFELLNRIDDAKNTAIYIDPPYIEKGAKYIHDFEDSDHFRLALLLKKFKKARVVVSYYDHPRLEKMYPDWSRVEITVTKSLANQNKRDHKNKSFKAKEVLLVNGQIKGRLFS